MEHFVAIANLTPKEWNGLLTRAAILKKEWRRKGNRPLLANKILAMVFQKPSLRTRVSFDVGMLQLGGHALYISPQEIGLGQRESVADVARVLSRFVDGIMARVFAHAHIEELAQNSRVPVINGLSDREHPCQALADLFTIQERRGNLRGLKLAYLGDGNNVARSLLFACALSGMKFSAASPQGYTLDDESLALAKQLGKRTHAQFSLVEDPTEAVKGADVLYTDVWTSMGQESEAAVRARLFPPYQINLDLVRKANRGALVMHCLPAHRGMEITDEVMDGPQSAVFDQAENRLHAQKAVLAELLAKKR